MRTSRAADGALLQQADRGDVGQGLDDPDVASARATGVGAEQVQRPDHLLRGAAAGRRGRSGTRPRPRGGRTAATARRLAQVGVDHRVPVRKQSRQGPSWFCSWKSSSSLTDSAEAAMYCSCPCGSAEQQPGGGGAADLGGAPGQRLEELDDVEVVDEGVRHLDEDLSQVISGDHAGSPSLVASCERVAAVVVHFASRLSRSLPATMSLATSLR